MAIAWYQPAIRSSSRSCGSVQCRASSDHSSSDTDAASCSSSTSRINKPSRADQMAASAPAVTVAVSCSGESGARTPYEIA